MTKNEIRIKYWVVVLYVIIGLVIMLNLASANYLAVMGFSLAVLWIWAAGQYKADAKEYSELNLILLKKHRQLIEENSALKKANKRRKR